MSRIDEVADVSVDNLGVIGVGAPESAPSVLRRDRVAGLVRAASERANFVVFDAGPLLDSASSVQLMRMADVVALAVPMRRQRVRHLQAVARQLESARGRLLPVITPSRRHGADPAAGSANPVSAGDAVAAKTAKHSGRGRKRSDEPVLPTTGSADETVESIIP
ncbi:MAG: hypothetical protein QM733_06510 [Ilumatobacteraceae bacterium]